MENLDQTQAQSPFHAGELAIQSRLRVRAKIDAQGRRIIRDYLPEQHRQFFSQLPYVIIGTVWNSLQISTLSLFPNVRRSPIIGD